MINCFVVYQNDLCNKKITNIVFPMNIRYHPRFMYHVWHGSVNYVIGYQGAIYQKESTLSDHPILLRMLAKFGPMEPQSGIF